MKTAITESFGIDVPILAFTHCRDVVVAVSKAGGMGVLGAVGLSERQLEIDLGWIEDELGPDRPYGVDLIVPAKYAGSDQGGMKLSDLVAMMIAFARCVGSNASGSPTHTLNGLAVKSTLLTSDVSRRVPNRSACLRNWSMRSGPMIPSGKPG